MRINLNLDDEAEFRAYVKELVAGQVRRILREDLGNIVSGEIAKLRLLQPNSPELSRLVEVETRKALYNTTAELQKFVRLEIQKGAKEIAGAHIHMVRDEVKAALVASIKNLI